MYSLFRCTDLLLGMGLPQLTAKYFLNFNRYGYRIKLYLFNLAMEEINARFYYI